jgi:Flp pilus assembly pilin Flp
MLKFAFIRRSELPAAATDAKESQPAEEAPRWPPRRAATAMEYLVVASFILVVLIAAVQHLGSMTAKLTQHDADATSFMNPENNPAP